jgi:hypothetical protein
MRDTLLIICFQIKYDFNVSHPSIIVFFVNYGTVTPISQLTSAL